MFCAQRAWLPEFTGGGLRLSFEGDDVPAQDIAAVDQDRRTLGLQIS
jgi:hypothetical protein